MSLRFLNHACSTIIHFLNLRSPRLVDQDWKEVVRKRKVLTGLDGSGRTRCDARLGSPPNRRLAKRVSSGLVGGPLLTRIRTVSSESCAKARALSGRLAYSRGMSKRRMQSETVIAYTHVSTEEQAVSGLGLADQRGVIDAEAQRRGWTDVVHLADEGYSAKNLSRPAIGEALAMLSSGAASVLVVSKLDRLSRSLLDFAALMERAAKEGWQLVVLDLNVDTTTPSGQLVAHVMGAFAQYERQLIGARTSAALQQKKRQGARLGRPRMLPASVVERICQERAQGGSLRAIAAGLTADAVPTAKGGLVWQVSTVAGVLKSVDLDAEAQAARQVA